MGNHLLLLSYIFFVNADYASTSFCRVAGGEPESSSKTSTSWGQARKVCVSPVKICWRRALHISCALLSSSAHSRSRKRCEDALPRSLLKSMYVLILPYSRKALAPRIGALTLKPKIGYNGSHNNSHKILRFCTPWYAPLARQLSPGARKLNIYERRYAILWTVAQAAP